MFKSESTLPKGWTLAPVADVALVEMGQSPPSSTYNRDEIGLPFFQGKTEFGALYPDVRMWCSQPRRIAYSDDVLLSVRAPIGPTNISPTKCCIGRGLAAIRPEQDLSLKYLLYVFRRYSDQLDAQGTGTTFKAISGKILRRFLIPVAPVAEQIRIADALDALFSDLDAGVAALERARDKLKLYRASILKAAVEGVLTTDWRGKHTEVEPASETTHEQPPTPDTAGASMIPEGWRRVFLEDVATVVAGNPAPQGPENFDEGGVPFVRVQDMGRLGARSLISDTKDRLTENTARKLRLFPAGTVLFTKSGASTLLNQRAILGRPMHVVSHIAAAIPEDGILSEWLYFCLSCVDFARYAHATTLPSLPLSRVRRIVIPLPPSAEQKAIVEAVDEQLSVVDRLEADIDARLAAARTLRQAILRDAFAGKLAPQDPDDEPAPALLARIAAERQARARDAAAAGRRSAPRRKRERAAPR